MMSEGKEITSAQDLPALDLKGTFANRFNVAVSPVLTRVVFGEFWAGNPDTDTKFHTALVMPTSDLLAFCNLVISLHAQNLKQNEALLAALANPAPKANHDGK